MPSSVTFRDVWCRDEFDMDTDWLGPATLSHVVYCTLTYALSHSALPTIQKCTDDEPALETVHQAFALHHFWKQIQLFD